MQDSAQQGDTSFSGTALPSGNDHDVVVIGGGIMGCMTAYELAKRGLRPLVIDKDTIGYEASSRNMGAIGALGKFAYELALPSADAWQEMNTILAEDIEFRRAGRLVAAYGEDDMPWLKRMQDRLQASGARIEMLDRAQTRERFPELGPNVFGSLFSPEDGTVNPMKVMAAVRKLLLRQGVDLAENTRVTGFRLANGAIAAVETEHGEIAAKAVVCAGGIWADSLLAKIGVKIPLQLITVLHAETKPLPPLFGYFFRAPRFAVRQFADGAVRISGGYRAMQVAHPLSPRDMRNTPIWVPRFVGQWRQVALTLDGPLTWAETVRFTGSASYPPKGFNVRIPDSLSIRNVEEARKVLPGMENAEFASSKGGLIDATPDALPAVGPVDRIPGLFVASGFTGQGFGLGPVVGKALAACVVGETPSVSLGRFRPERFGEGNFGPFPGIG